MNSARFIHYNLNLKLITQFIDIIKSDQILLEYTDFLPGGVALSVCELMWSERGSALQRFWAVL